MEDKDVHCSHAVLFSNFYIFVSLCKSKGTRLEIGKSGTRWDNAWIKFQVSLNYNYRGLIKAMVLRTSYNFQK